ncbi:MAG TPA: TRAP transporter large permease [Clostridiales bacterium]|nr:TRAP transporter large permease [Clostridiales bacterium]
MLTITLVLLILTLLLGVPVPLAFFGTAMLLFFASGDYQLSFLLSSGISKASTTLLFAIPLFIMGGGIMERGNIGSQLISLVELAVKRVKGGLGIVGVVASALFGSVTGSACATISCIGTIMFPKLANAGIPRGHAAALMANASILGMLIPPSGIMILYAWLSGQSVLACFLSTVIPGILLATLLSIINVILLRNDPNVKEVELTEKKPGETLKRWKDAAPALMMPVIVLGGIYSGVMTPTEAAAVAVIYSIPVGMFIYKGLNIRNLKESIVSSATTTGVIMFMLICVMVLSRIYIMEDVPSRILNMLRSISENKLVILFVLNIFMVIIGMIMDDTSAVLLCTPILVPVVTQLGISPIHFAAILGVNLGLGNITPPCAPLLYLGGRLGGAPINEMMRPAMTMIIFGWIPTLLLTTYVPGLATFLPDLILGIK